MTVQHELRITSYLAGRGAAVAAPYDDTGPHLVGDQAVTLWHFVDHDPDLPLDAREAGRALHEMHDLLVEPEAPDLSDLPHFVRLEHAAEVVAALDATEEDRNQLDEMLALATTVLGRLDLPLQPLHGDAWLGNVLHTPAGPVWSDFELVCRGPREVDLAANQSVAKVRGGTPADEELLAGYGDVDRELVEWLLPLAIVPFVAGTFRLAGERLEFLPVARRRLELSLEGLRRTTG